jgi:MscS family membrane protein
MVVVPNGQIANATIETLSARDKFWFHPLVNLRFETTPSQILLVVTGIRRLLAECPSVEPDSIRVRFFRLGTYSLDLDIFAYVHADDWNHFLGIQEELLLEAMDIVKQAGTDIAISSQTMYLSARPSEKEAPLTAVLAPVSKAVPEKPASKSA